MSIYKQIEDRLATLPAPQCIEVKSFDDFLAELVEDAKTVLGSDWRPLESDPYMKKLRVIALRKMHDQADKNNIIKEVLLTTATGTNLDHKALARGVVRDEGEYPYALYRFELSGVLDHDIVIPKGTVLNSDDDQYRAETMEEGIILAGAESVDIRVQLFDFVPNSDIEISNIVTELPYVATATQLEPFHDGDGVEDDERLRLRAIASVAISSTAGAEDAYKWRAYSADSRIKDLYINSVRYSMTVDIYLHADSVDDAMIERVEDACTPRSVRPLSDYVLVHPATVKEISVSATIEVYDLLKAGEIERSIRANFDDAFGLGMDFVRSDLDRKCHIDGVYRVVSDFTDVTVQPNEVIRITELDLSFSEVDR